jgi:shikimate kinase
MVQTRIYLVGFMGSGKSHVGFQLGEQLGLPFLDLDRRIEIEQRKSIGDIFAQEGPERFRQIERQVLHDTCYYPPYVIATGGGAPCFFDNMEWMNRHGLTLFLDVPEDILLERLLLGRAHRPLLLGKSRQELADYIQTTLAARRPYYEQAAVTSLVQTAREDVASRIAQDFGQITGH